MTTANKTPRVISPEVAAIRAEAKAKVEAFRKEQASAGILKTIIDKQLPRMTDADKAKLHDAVAEFSKP